MKIYEVAVRKQIEVDNVVCNICGRLAVKDSFGYLEEFLEIQKKWGYHSDFDGEEHSFELCPDCYKRLIDTFAIPVNRKNGGR